MISVMHKRLLVLTHSNLFVLNAPFLNSLKAPENPKIFCFQWVEKGCIGNNCVNNFCSLSQKYIMWGWVMTQNWVSQVVSSLGICRQVWKMGISETVWHRKVLMESWYKTKKIFVNIAEFLFAIFYAKMSCYLQIKMYR